MLLVMYIVAYVGISYQQVEMVSEVGILMWHYPTGSWGCYKVVSELQCSTLSLDGPIDRVQKMKLQSLQANC
jgi:hypothetical protein